MNDKYANVPLNELIRIRDDNAYYALFWFNKRYDYDKHPAQWERCRQLFLWRLRGYRLYTKLIADRAADRIAYQ